MWGMSEVDTPNVYWVWQNGEKVQISQIIRNTLAETDLSVAEIAEGLGVPDKWVMGIEAEMKVEEQDYD